MSCVKRGYATKSLALAEITRMSRARPERGRRPPADIERTASRCKDPSCGLYHINYNDRYGHANTRQAA